jgi:hypothetical protein
MIGVDAQIAGPTAAGSAAVVRALSGGLLSRKSLVLDPP